MGNSCSPGCRWWCLQWRLFVLSFFPLDILDEIWNLIESVSKGFLTYSLISLKCYFSRSNSLLARKISCLVELSMKRVL